MKSLPLIFGLNLLVLSLSAPVFAQDSCTNDSMRTGERVNNRTNPKELQPKPVESPRADDGKSQGSSANSQGAK